ncbi:unnamed protein product [Mytilus edulis]|uniref:Integrase p58-like C-terminal domain-containing protein n=1 Tax=Mytilus edulis TaxID=6550 RepID=A0A8S3VCI1_MYTED|nr:unnamed protein product [Mytilus edulis]
MMTGTYILQSDKHKFTHFSTEATCQLCHTESEDIVHMITTCPVLSTIREKYFIDIKKVILDSSHAHARKHLKGSQEYQKKYYDQSAKKRELIAGQPVWLHDPTRKPGVCSKLLPKWKGPFIVLKKIDDLIYMVKKSPRQPAKVYHIDRLIPYKGRNPPTWIGQTIPETDVVGTPRQGIREPSVESAVSEWEQDVPTITLEEDAPMEEYDPLLPSVLTLHSIQMNTDGPLIALFTIRVKEMIWYRVEIDQVIRMVEKFKAALERKANTIRPTDISTMSHSGSPVYGEEFYHKQQMCADTLNISPALITRIERRPDIFSSVSKTKPIVAPTKSPLAPTNQSPSATSSAPKSSSSIPKPPSSASKPPSSAPKPPSSVPKPPSSVPKPPSSVPKSPSPASKPPTSASKSPSSLIASRPVVQPPSSSTDLTLAEETPIQKKAREILTLGSMPAIPPARRDWKTKSIKIPTGSTFLQWPPREWETLTPDSKLLAWEFAASQLEYHSTGKFPKLDRVDLLDKYNFLALPGTKEQKIKGKENLVRKCR